jgi:predicted DNA-binding transcriptional regulator YafY
LWIKDELAILLGESPIAANQVITPYVGQKGGYELKATLTDSALLIWWLRSQGAGVQVLAPQSLIEALTSTT